MKQVFFSFLTFVFILFVCVSGSVGCANIIPPEGGPRDSLPPVLVSASPRDSTLNFKGNRIVLQFDEYIDLRDVQNNLLFTPTFEVNPIIEAKLRTITVRLKDSLAPNTTYTFNFGNAVTDINENNVLRDFVYTFSTGAYIDSLTLSGNVVLAETGEVDTTLTVILHPTFNDSAVVKTRPSYVARLNSSGAFTFRNLPADTFAIYVLGDAGITRRYNSKSQLFAFNDKTIVTPDTSKLTLYAYREVPPLPASTSTTAAAQAKGEKRLLYSTNLTGNQQDILENLVFTFDRPLRFFDSTKIVFATDSTFTPVVYTASLDTTKKILTLQTTWQPDIEYHLLLRQDFAEDTLRRRLLKADTLTFTTRSVEEYGALAITLRNIDTAQNPVLQFVQNEVVVFSAPVKSGFFRQPAFLPGEYDLRLLYDKNNNGKW
ncbi:MAG TPA: Ig-like domain-containing protein, partial [Chitinophagaceae bacterium]|nr:Ig-like domain-containing protein [Chitinophagaceae bacterium]